MPVEKSTRSELTIYLLGRLEFWRDNQLLPPLATHKTQSLLAYLILHCKRIHLREELAALFWGDRDDVHARHSLTTALWRIRKSLGKGFLLTDSLSVQFDPTSEFWLDVTEFEKRVKSRQKPENLAVAIDLYRGDLLEGFYDDWCIEERYYLESLYLDALRQLIEWHEAQGNAREVLVYAQKYLTRDPLMHNIHLAAMRSFVELGDLTGAQRQWQLCCAMRQRDLHAPPSQEMIKQAKKLLGEYFAVSLPAESLQLGVQPRLDSLERPPFVGRGREMNALRARWEKAIQGQGGMVLISGEAGVGKTRLSEELAAEVRWHGGTVACGHCYEPERMLPYQPLIEILRHLTQQEEHVILNLPAWAKNELTRLIPDLVTSSPIQPKPSTASPQPDQQAILFHAIATLLRQCSSSTPLLIVLDDLHWAADSTLAALHYLVRHTADVRVLYLGTYRPEDVIHPHDLLGKIAQLVREGFAEHLALERLSIEAISELVQRTFKAEAGFVDRLYEHTQGNIFFSIETLRALAGAPLSDGPLPVPDNVRTLIESRLGRLSVSAREWIAFAAVAGRTFDFDLVCHSRGIREDDALEAMDELLRQGFLREESGVIGSDYEFVHHLVQEATYMGIHHRRRRRMHRLIGEAMESLHVDRSSVSSVLAHHFEVGGEVEKALYYHELAAQKATTLFAWQEAEEHLGRMLQLLDQVDPDCKQAVCLRRRGQILINRTELRSLQGHLTGRDADLDALGVIAEISRDEYLRLQTRVQRARYLNLDAQYEQAILVAKEGLAFAKSLQDNAARCYLLTQIGFAHYFLGQPQPALTALESALGSIPDTDSETRRHTLHILGYVHFHLGNYARALAYQQESYSIHQSIGDYNGAAWAGLDMAATCQKMGRMIEAVQYLSEHLNLARRIGARSAEGYGLIQSGSWELCQGNYASAEETFRQALLVQQELRTEHGRVAAEIGIGIALYHLGDTTQAQRWLEQAVERARPIQHRRRLVEALLGLGLVACAVNQPQTAHHYLTEALAIALDSECRENLAAVLAALARAERHLGNLASALAYASEAVQIASEIAVPVCEMWGELEEGLTRLAQGDSESALAHTQRAVDLVPQSGESWISIEQVHRAHALVLRALHRFKMADEQDRLANAIIEAKAVRIPHPQQRQLYLKYAKSDL